METQKMRARLTDFIQAEYDRFVGYVRKRIEDTGARDGEDIVQDVMLNIFSLADITAPIENISAYLYRALQNRVVDQIRKRRPGVVSLDDDVAQDAGLSLADLLYDAAGDISDRYEQQEALDFLFSAIDSLGEDQRDIIIQSEFEGRSFRELSEAGGVPLGTLLARKSRALNNLRKIFSDMYEG